MKIFNHNSNYHLCKKIKENLDEDITVPLNTPKKKKYSICTYVHMNTLEGTLLPPEFSILNLRVTTRHK